MASINKDNLREEESLGGFEPGQAEDDSFMLEGQEEYPGELPDFDSDDEPVVIEDSHEVPTTDSADSAETPEPDTADDDVPEDVDMADVDMAEQIEPPAAGGSVWDSFEEEDTGTEEPDVEVDTEGLIPKQEEYVVEPKKGASPKETEEVIAEPEEQPIAEEKVTGDVTEEKITEEEIIEEEISNKESEAGQPAAEEKTDEVTEEAVTEIPEGIEDLIIPTETPDVETEEIDEVTDEVSGDTEVEEEAAEIDETPHQEAEGVLDDDFKKALAGDIEKSKARKEESKAEEPAENEADETETTEMKPEDFTPVDDHEDAQLIDINEIEADKPSNYGLEAGIETASLPKTDEMKIAGNATGPEAMPVEGGVKLKKKKKRRNRKPLPIKRIAIIALIIIFGAAVAFVGYNYIYKSDDGGIAHLDSLAASDSAANIHEEISKGHEEEISHEDGEEISHKDGEEISHKDGEEISHEDGEEISHKDGEEISHKNGEEINHKNGEEAHKIAPKDALGNHGEHAENTEDITKEAATTEKPKAKLHSKEKLSRKKYVARVPVKKSTSHKQKKAKQKPITKKDIAEKTVIVKPKKPVEIKHKKPVEVKHEKPVEIKHEKPAQKKRIGTKLPELPLPKSDKGLFTIQIYATPSREDAEEWLSKLRNKNIRDSFISKHQIRDQIWYRVRFGKFETKEEARSTALRYGFAQTWIDRVR